MEFKKLTLKNGLRAILIPRPKSVAATVLILVEAGAEYETKNINGLSHFLEHMTFKGTSKRPEPGQIAEELAALGAQSNAFTSYEYTGYWAKVEYRKLPKIMEIVSDLYLNPLFNPTEIDKERGVIIEEINMYEDMPMRKVHDLLTSLLYGDQPAGWDVAGHKEIIKKLSRDDFVTYRSKHYVPQKTLVVVAGNFDPKRTEAQVRGYFENVKKGTRTPRFRTKERQARPELMVKFKESDQSHLVLGVRAFDLFDKRRYAIQVLADVIGGGMSSRLFKRIREQMGAAYYVSASPDLYLDHGYLAVSAGVDHLKASAVIEAIIEEFRRISKELVPAKELQKSKDHLIGNLMLELETSDELASYYGSQEILARKTLHPQGLVDKIQNIKAEEVRAVARAIFKDKNLNLAVIGPYKHTGSFKKILRL
ncbi:MAG: pitrilysin family protein [Patescibacteria group bacterium]